MGIPILKTSYTPLLAQFEPEFTSDLIKIASGFLLTGSLGLGYLAYATYKDIERQREDLEIEKSCREGLKTIDNFLDEIANFSQEQLKDRSHMIRNKAKWGVLRDNLWFDIKNINSPCKKYIKRSTIDRVQLKAENADKIFKENSKYTVEPSKVAEIIHKPKPPIHKTINSRYFMGENSNQSTLAYGAAARANKTTGDSNAIVPVAIGATALLGAGIYAATAPFSVPASAFMWGGGTVTAGLTTLVLTNQQKKKPEKS